MCVIRVLGGSVLFVIFVASTSEVACPFCLCFFQEMQIFHFFSIFGASPDSWVCFVFPKRVVNLLVPLRKT